MLWPCDPCRQEVARGGKEWPINWALRSKSDELGKMLILETLILELIKVTECDIQSSGF